MTIFCGELVGRFFTWLAGADLEILDRIRTDRAKYVSIGTVIMLTSALACISMSFALHTALRVPLPVAIPLAVGWGIAIMTMDRALIVSLRPGSGKLKYAALVLFRVLIAAVLGTVVSTPVTLQVFQPEIKAQLDVIHSRNAASFSHQQATDALGRKIARLTTAQQQQSRIISGGGVSQVSDLVGQRTAALAKEQKDYDQWQCQLYGGPGCTVAGSGPLATAKRNAYNADVALVGRRNDEIKAAEEGAVRLAQVRLGEVSRALQVAQAEQSGPEAAFHQDNAADAGLLLRLEALDQVAGQNPVLNSARWLLFSLFAFFELMPVLVKILMNAGQVTSYERALRAEDAALLAVSEQLTAACREERLKLVREVAPETVQHDGWPAQSRSASPTAGGIGGPGSARSLASAAAATLVRSMATESWPAMRNAAAGLWSRYQPPYLADRSAADLDAANAVIARARQMGDRSADGAAAAEWEGRILALLTLQPAAAADIGEIADRRDGRASGSRTLR
jgi:hypothetical protein